MKVTTVKSIIPGPFVKVWRHPVWWWKMRHLRHDLKQIERQFSPKFWRALHKKEEEAFLFGTGGEL